MKGKKTSYNGEEGYFLTPKQYQHAKTAIDFMADICKYTGIRPKNTNFIQNHSIKKEYSKHEPKVEA